MSIQLTAIADYLVQEYERLFPGQAAYSPVVRQAIYARFRRIDAIFAFYDANGADGSRDAAGNLNPTHPKIREICERTFRDVLKAELASMSETSGFMLRNFIRMNRQKTAELVASFLQSEAITALTNRYSFTIPVLAEASSPEWLSSQLGL